MTVLNRETGLVHVAETMTCYPSNPRHAPYEVTVTECDEEVEGTWVKVDRAPTCLWCMVRW